MKKILCAFLACLMLVLACAPAFAADYYYVKTSNGKTLNMRETPKSGTNNLIGQIPYGTRVKIVYYVNANWVLALPDGWSNPAFCMRRYLVDTNPGTYTPSKKKAATKADDNPYASFKRVTGTSYVTVKAARSGGFANLRWAPSKSSALIEKVYDGTDLRVIAVGDEWYQVMDEENGFVGFLNTSFIAK